MSFPASEISSAFFFVLASGSPRRREFMRILGLPFIVVSPDTTDNQVDETPLPAETPAALVQRLSRIKAAAVLAALSTLTLPALISSTSSNPESQTIVIAADTVVVLEGEILGKPKDQQQARHMLTRLRQQYHTVYTGLTIALAPQARTTVQPPQLDEAQQALFITRLHQSNVWMRSYTDAELEAYIATGDPLDKAGAYGIQNRIFAPVARLEGCFASVMGFPLGELAAVLKTINIPLPKIGPLCSRLTGHPCCQQ